MTVVVVGVAIWLALCFVLMLGMARAGAHADAQQALFLLREPADRPLAPQPRSHGRFSRSPSAEGVIAEVQVRGDDSARFETVLLREVDFADPAARARVLTELEAAMRRIVLSPAQVGVSGALEAVSRDHPGAEVGEQGHDYR